MRSKLKKLLVSCTFKLIPPLHLSQHQSIVAIYRLGLYSFTEWWVSASYNTYKIPLWWNMGYIYFPLWNNSCHSTMKISFNREKKKITNCASPTSILVNTTKTKYALEYTRPLKYAFYSTKHMAIWQPLAIIYSKRSTPSPFFLKFSSLLLSPSIHMLSFHIQPTIHRQNTYCWEVHYLLLEFMGKLLQQCCNSQ